VIGDVRNLSAEGVVEGVIGIPHQRTAREAGSQSQHCVATIDAPLTRLSGEGTVVATLQNISNEYASAVARRILKAVARSVRSSDLKTQCQLSPATDIALHMLTAASAE
jgi:hypothetical protein